MKRLRNILIILGISLVLLELVLQLGALAVWFDHRRAADAVGADGTDTVLCVGDSFTYGDGASSPETNYPAVLEQLLEQAHGIDCHVVNAGWPGQNSRDVLLHLTGQIDKFAPDVVCVLVGINDTWSRPALLEGGEQSGGFALRTPRLFKWLFQNEGTWQQSGPADHGQPTPKMLRLGMKMLAELGLTGDDSTRWRLPSPETTRAIKKVRTLLATGRRDEAIAAARALAPPHHELQLAEILTWLVKQGERERAIAVVDELRSAYREAPTAANAGALLATLRVVGEWEEALAIAQKVVAEHPDAAEAWRVIAIVNRGIDVKVSMKGFAQFLRLLPPRELRYEAPWPLRMMGQFNGFEAPETAVRQLVAATLLDSDIEPSAGKVRISGGTALPLDLILEIAESPELDATGAEVLRRLHAAARDDSTDRYLAVYRAHLERMIGATRAKGAAPVLLTYPFWSEPLEQVLGEVASEHHVPLIDIVGRFRDELATRPRSELFGDSHCNDAGYAIMAEMVAAEVAPLLKPQ